MCRELDTLRQSILAYAKGFDARSLTPVQAGDVIRACAHIESSVASIKALAAARSAEGNSWRREGYRSAADQLAHEAGMSPAAAKRALATGQRMADQPEVALAALTGELSLEKAAAVSDCVAANPGKARELIEKARTSSVPELVDEVARTKATGVDLEARRQQIHAERSVKFFRDPGGCAHTRVSGHPEDQAALSRMITPVRRRLHQLARQADRFETFDALDYDALITLANIAVGKTATLNFSDLIDLGLFPQVKAGLLEPPAAPEANLFTALDPESPPEPLQPPKRRPQLPGGPAEVLIRVDYAALLRGFPADGEVCEMAGHGPIPLSVVEAFLATENAFLIGLLTRGEEVLQVYRHGRRYPNAAQKSALDWLYPTCAVAGCNATTRLQTDHREDYSRTHFTVLDLLDRLCTHHHNLNTRDNWALLPGIGKRRFVPPDHPLHPRQAGASPPRPA